jgi:KaiC/GvpD/RAD55 family RecA-like ATPase
MKLHVRHRFDCTPDRFWKMYWDDAFDEQLRRESAVQRELLEERTEGTVLIRRVRLTPDRELPGAAAALLGARKLVYEQENRWDKSTSTMAWKVIPTILPGKLDARGTFQVVGAGTGCEQVVDGVISVNVMLVGGQIERAVVAEVEKSYDKMAITCREWLRTHP